MEITLCLNSETSIIIEAPKMFFKSVISIKKLLKDCAMLMDKLLMGNEVGVLNLHSKCVLAALQTSLIPWSAFDCLS